MSHSEQYRGHTIRIEPDTDAESPHEWDNLGVMTCFHKRYALGDKTELKSSDFDSWEELRKHLEKEGAEVILPIFMFDHSGLTLATSSERFRACDSQGWDWGQVGFIWITREKILSEYGWKRITKARRDKICGYLDGEVKTYSQYLEGDVYGYVIETEDGEEDSCWGFYGQDEALAEAKGIVDYKVNASSVPV